MVAFALFDTSIGTCGIAWTEKGIRGIQLPEHDAGATRARLLRRHAGAHEAVPPANVQQSIDAIVTLLGGADVDLSGAVIDDADLPVFHRRVYGVARRIQPGSTRTYGSIACELGDPLLAQQVGQALGKNPFPIIVPCHRVLAANGSLGGFSAPGGKDTKKRMLLIERALPDEPLDLFGAE